MFYNSTLLFSRRFADYLLRFETIKTDYEFILPISIAKIENYFFIGLGNGEIIKIDINGKMVQTISTNRLNIWSMHPGMDKTRSAL